MESNFQADETKDQIVESSNEVVDASKDVVDTSKEILEVVDTFKEVIPVRENSTSTGIMSLFQSIGSVLAMPVTSLISGIGALMVDEYSEANILIFSKLCLDHLQSSKLPSVANLHIAIQQSLNIFDKFTSNRSGAMACRRRIYEVVLGMGCPSGGLIFGMSPSNDFNPDRVRQFQEDLDIYSNYFIRFTKGNAYFDCAMDNALKEHFESYLTMLDEFVAYMYDHLGLQMHPSAVAGKPALRYYCQCNWKSILDGFEEAAVGDESDDNTLTADAKLLNFCIEQNMTPDIRNPNFQDKAVKAVIDNLKSDAMSIRAYIESLNRDAVTMTSPSPTTSFATTFIRHKTIRAFWISRFGDDCFAVPIARFAEAVGNSCINNREYSQAKADKFASKTEAALRALIAASNSTDSTDSDPSSSSSATPSTISVLHFSSTQLVSITPRTRATAEENLLGNDTIEKTMHAIMHMQAKGYQRYLPDPSGENVNSSASSSVAPQIIWNNENELARIKNILKLSTGWVHVSGKAHSGRSSQLLSICRDQPVTRDVLYLDCMHANSEAAVVARLCAQLGFCQVTTTESFIARLCVMLTSLRNQSIVVIDNTESDACGAFASGLVCFSQGLLRLLVAACAPFMSKLCLLFVGPVNCLAENGIAAMKVITLPPALKAEAAESIATALSPVDKDSLLTACNAVALGRPATSTDSCITVGLINTLGACTLGSIRRVAALISSPSMSSTAQDSAAVLKGDDSGNDTVPAQTVDNVPVNNDNNEETDGAQALPSVLESPVTVDKEVVKSRACEELARGCVAVMSRDEQLLVQCAAFVQSTPFEPNLLWTIAREVFDNDCLRFWGAWLGLMRCQWLQAGTDGYFLAFIARAHYSSTNAQSIFSDESLFDVEKQNFCKMAYIRYWCVQLQQVHDLSYEQPAAMEIFQRNFQHFRVLFACLTRAYASNDNSSSSADVALGKMVAQQVSGSLSQLLASRYSTAGAIGILGAIIVILDNTDSCEFVRAASDYVEFMAMDDEEQVKFYWNNDFANLYAKLTTSTAELTLFDKTRSNYVIGLFCLRARSLGRAVTSLQAAVDNCATMGDENETGKWRVLKESSRTKLSEALAARNALLGLTTVLITNNTMTADATTQQQLDASTSKSNNITNTPSAAAAENTQTGNADDAADQAGEGAAARKAASPGCVLM